MTLTTDTDTLQFDRSFGISADQLWNLMTAPENRAAWGAPDPSLLMDVVSADLSIGGTDHQRCGPADAPEFESLTRWYNLVAPTDATYTEQIMAGGITLGTSLVTYRISDTEQGSELTITVAVSSFVGPEMMEEFRLGWAGSMNNLEALVKRQ